MNPTRAVANVLLSSTVVFGALHGSAQAQVVPANSDTNTIVTPSGNTFDITGGTTAGTNLFHSFQTFGLNADQIANFRANPAVQNILGRVVGGDASIINGLIRVTGSNANLYLMNPAGIVFGANARLDVAGSFTATTANGIGLGDKWFKAIGSNDYANLIGNPGSFAFTMVQPGAIVNAGNLAVGTGQSITLLGGTVINTGTLTAPGGKITVAAVPGEKLVNISQDGSLLHLALPVETDTAVNALPFTPLALPQLLTGGNLSNATGIAVQNGAVKLTSSGVIVPTDPGTAIVANTMNVSGTSGGTVYVLGNKVGLVGANINASGTNGGGTVLIGGDYQGKGTVPNAQQTFVSPDSVIRVDALQTGNGGRAIVWANGATRFYGSVSARGGAQIGNGGFVEVSGKNNLAFDGAIDVGATIGTGGQLLLDPASVVIGTNGTNNTELDDGQILASDPGGTFFISAAKVVQALNTGSVEIAALSNLDINNNIDASANPNHFALTLDAPRINLNASIFTSDANVTFNGAVLIGNTITVSTGTGSGNISFNGRVNAVNAPQELTLAAGNGNITFVDAIGSTNTLPGDTALTFRISDVSPDFGSFLNVNGTLLFAADDGVHGLELWKSDGTTIGTQLVKDINPGAANSNPKSLTDFNGTLVFTADDGTTGTELWRSDGTTIGTQLLRDINPGSLASSPGSLVNANGTLFFSANDGTSGNELWRSNGTTIGTQLVKDIRPGIEGSFPGLLTNVNGTLFFGANDGTNGNELWSSDGTKIGTQLVRDIQPGATGSSLSELTNINGTLFFTADNGVGGQELWQSNGTFAGTQLVRDIRPGAESSSPRSLTNVNNTLFFVADDGVTGEELWRSNGTFASTQLVRDIQPGATGSSLSELTNINGTLFFTANDGVVGQELWQSSDGTSAGTQLVRDILPGTNGSFPRSLTNVNNILFFTADDGVTGEELWRSNGTVGSTQLVHKIGLNTSGSFPNSLTNVNGTLFFAADNALWQSNGIPSTYAFNQLSITTTSATNLTAGTITLGHLNINGGNVTVNGAIKTSDRATINTNQNVALNGTLISQNSVSIAANTITTRDIQVRQPPGNTVGLDLSSQGNIQTGNLNIKESVNLVSTAGNIAVETIEAFTTSTSSAVAINITTPGLFQARGILQRNVNLPLTRINIDAPDNADVKQFLRSQGILNTDDSINATANKPTGFTKPIITVDAGTGQRTLVVEFKELPISILVREGDPGGRIRIQHGGKPVNTDSTKTNPDGSKFLTVTGNGETQFVIGPQVTRLSVAQFVIVPDFSAASSGAFYQGPALRYLNYSALTFGSESFPIDVSGTVGAIATGAGSNANLGRSFLNIPFVPVGGGDPPIKSGGGDPPFDRLAALRQRFQGEDGQVAQRQLTAQEKDAACGATSTIAAVPSGNRGGGTGDASSRATVGAATSAQASCHSSSDDSQILQLLQDVPSSSQSKELELDRLPQRAEADQHSAPTR